MTSFYSSSLECLSDSPIHMHNLYVPECVCVSVFTWAYTLSQTRVCHFLQNSGWQLALALSVFA